MSHWMLALCYLLLWCPIGIGYQYRFDVPRMAALVLVTLILGFLVTRRLRISDNPQRLFFYVLAYIGLTMIPGSELPAVVEMVGAMIANPSEALLTVIMLPLYVFWAFFGSSPFIFVPLVGLVFWIVARFTLSEPADTRNIGEVVDA